jgi:Fe-S-cluster containining protein
MQCRTFPFWPENVQSARAWEALKSFCPGIDEGDWHSPEEIREQVEIQKMYDRKLRQFNSPKEKSFHNMPQNEITKEGQ